MNVSKNIKIQSFKIGTGDPLHMLMSYTESVSILTME